MRRGSFVGSHVDAPSTPPSGCDAMKERASAPGGCWKLQGIRLHQVREAHDDGSIRRPAGRRDGPAPAAQRAGADDPGRAQAGDRPDRELAGRVAGGAGPGRADPRVVVEATYGWY